MHIEHINFVLALERGKTDRRAFQGSYQCQFAGKLFAEGGGVIRGRCPSLLLRLSVVVGRQFLDAVAEDLAQQWRVGRQEGPQAELWMGGRAHRRSPGGHWVVS